MTESRATEARLPPLLRYDDHDSRAGVTGYAMSHNAITVAFSDGSVYQYSHKVPGRLHVDRMKSLAAAGVGLGTYISRQVGKRFAARLR